MNKEIPTKDELKLIIDKSLLEQEKRITKSLNDSLTAQNQTYMTHIIRMTEDIANLKTVQSAQAQKIDGFPRIVTTVSIIAGSITGLVGFFVAQITK